ncbi:lipopolysaccharide kinase InaA family protein [Alcaligenaceae bacterium A4P071]|nr:lipopolysaccharide kinase InaA family protein [Alcaligenaceae bacterium A4P071]
MPHAQTQTIDWWQWQGEWVEPPNHRRGGESGVQFVRDADGNGYYIKRQRNFLFKSLRYPLGRPTFLREARNLKRLNQLGVSTPKLVHFDMRRVGGIWEAVLATRELAGYVSLEQGLRDNRWPAHTRAKIYRLLAEHLLRMHRAAFKHGHLYPKEIFAHCDGDDADPQIALMDLELGRRCLTAAQAANSDLRRLFHGLRKRGLSEDEIAIFRQVYSAAKLVPKALKL